MNLGVAGSNPAGRANRPIVVASATTSTSFAETSIVAVLPATG